MIPAHPTVTPPQSGSGRKKQRRVHYSRKMAVVLVAAVVLGLVVRAVSMGLFAK